jgi:hypothetical protein
MRIVFILPAPADTFINMMYLDFVAISSGRVMATSEVVIVWHYIIVSFILNFKGSEDTNGIVRYTAGDTPLRRLCAHTARPLYH